MTTKHTPEPWELNPTTENRSITSKNGVIVFCYDVSIPDSAQHIPKANATRIVECVNALAGIENPAEWVEKMNKIAFVLALDDLKMARNEAAKLGFGNFGKPYDYETQIQQLTKENEELKQILLRSTNAITELTKERDELLKPIKGDYHESNNTPPQRRLCGGE